jgi:DNA-binding XRE family transcriptional regulator
MQGKLTVKQLRALANLTQRDAAKLLGIHRNTFMRLENDPGRMQLAQAAILTEMAGVGLEQVLFT